MAYKLLYNDEILFDPYSDNMVMDAQLTSKYNNPDYFDFTVPITNDLYSKLSEQSGSVKLFYDNEKIFDGIITSIDIDMDGNKAVQCSGPLYYLNDTLVRPYSTTSGESQTIAPDTISGIFQWYIDQHNEHTMDPKKHFSVGVNQGAMLSENNTFSRTSDSLPTTWDEISNAILEDHGGFIFVEYSGDSNVLNLYGDIHESNSQIIDFGVNIVDFSKTTDTADQYTAIRPSGYTPEAPEDDSDKKMYPITIADLPDNPVDSDLVKKGDVVYSASAVQRYGYKEYAYSNTDITDTSILLKTASVLLKTLTSPAETITVKAVDLALYMSGYKHLRVGQAVRIRSKLHSTDEYMMVNSIVLDINDPSNTEYEFGIPNDTLTGQQSSYLKNMNASINSAIDTVAGLDQATKDAAKTAEAAKNTANAANDTANTAKDAADTAKSTATEAYQNAEAIGGQNLLLGTSVITVVEGTETTGQCAVSNDLAAGNLTNLPTGMYHMQFKIKSDTAGGTAYAQWNSDPGSIGDTTIDIGTDEQTYSVDYYITDNNYPDATQMTVQMDNAKGNVTISEMKLERGSTMTSWTAAPEDSVNDLVDVTQKQADTISSKVDVKTFTKYTNDTDAALDSSQNSIETLNKKITEEIQSREAYITFGADEDNPYMDMGTSGSSSKLHLTNTELDFIMENTKVAWFSNQQLVVNNTVVNNSLTIGNFIFRYRPNGHLTLQHI